MLKGPLPLLFSREEIQDIISFLLVGDIKNYLLLGLLRKVLKDFVEEK